MDCNDWLPKPPEEGDEAARLKARSQRNRKQRFKNKPSPRRRPGSHPHGQKHPMRRDPGLRRGDDVICVGVMRQPCVYILTNRSNQLFYIGVTSNIAARMMQHRAGKGAAHCRRYNIRKLVHAEFHVTMVEAIAREKALKEWHRDWKRKLIDEANPDWNDLFDNLLN